MPTFGDISISENYFLQQRQTLHPIVQALHWVLLSSPGRVAQSVGHLTRKSVVLESIPGLATYFRFSFRFLKRAVVMYWRKYVH